jgi:hypothetical protein
MKRVGFASSAVGEIQLDFDQGLVHAMARRAKPLFARCSRKRLIQRLGNRQTSMVTAELYFLSTRISDFVADARHVAGLTNNPEDARSESEPNSRIGAQVLLGAEPNQTSKGFQEARQGYG